ncbi:MAG: 1-acyl-sn-glycerol-3-phosphate acyltransferase [Deltaproteobacteria bacterium]|nr:1-acyl-sn-glycerol-3-phosphate acyltransferase [Deltaproteobacteria bacterium]
MTFSLKSIVTLPFKKALNRIDYVKITNYLGTFEPGHSYAFQENKLGPAFNDQEQIARLAVDLAFRSMESNGEKPNRQELEGQVGIITCQYDWELHRTCKSACFNILPNIFTPRDLKHLFVSNDLRELRFLPNLKKAQDDGIGIVYLINHTSHFDEFLFDLFLDRFNLHLPLFAAGDNMMATPSLTRIFKVGSYVIVRKGASHTYLSALSNYCQALAEMGKPQGIFLEAWSGGARTRDGSLRYPRRLVAIKGSLASRGDVLVQPVVISYSRVPEDRDLADGKSVLSWLNGNHIFKEILKQPTHPLKAIAKGLQGVFGRTFIGFGEGKLLSTLKEEWKEDPQGLELDEYTALYAIKEIARDKKIMSSQVAALALGLASKRNSTDFVTAATESLEIVKDYHARVFDREPDFEDFIRDNPLEQVLEDGFNSLLSRKIIRKKLPFTKGVYRVVSPHGLSYYATHSDRRLYSPAGKENMVVCGAGPWGYAIVTQVGRRTLNDRKFHNSSLSLFDSTENLIHDLAYNRSHPLFPEYLLPKNVFPTSDSVEAFRKANDVIIAAPPIECAPLFQLIFNQAPDLRSLILATRGFDPLSHRLTIQIAWEAAVAAEKPNINILALSGPFLPLDLLTDKGGVWILAGPFRENKLPEASLFKQGNFLVETSDDPLGVQVAAAMADAYTLYGSYLKTHRELQTPEAMTAYVKSVSCETKLLAMAIGAKPTSFDAGSPAWLAEFIYGVLSVSRHNTIKLAASGGGEAIRLILNDPDSTQRWPDRGIIGYYSIRSAHLLAKHLSLKMPLLEDAYTTFWGKTPLELF